MRLIPESLLAGCSPSEPVDKSDNSEPRRISCFSVTFWASRGGASAERVSHAVIYTAESALLGPDRRWRGFFSSAELWQMTVPIISILAVAITIGPSLANGSEACMRESEARAKFPKAHLIWLGTNHCWTFGAVPVHSRRPVLAAEPVPSLPPAPAAEPSPGPVVSDEVTAVQCRYSPCK